MKFFQRFKAPRTRSTERDQATDEKRLGGLIRHIDMIVDEITFERNGISKRYLQIAEDTGFLMESSEAEPDNDQHLKKLQEFEKNLLMFKSRIRTLNMQMTELKQLKDKLTSNFNKIDLENKDLV